MKLVEEDKCWRCESVQTNFLHIWWQCKKVKFWLVVSKEIEMILKVRIRLHPKVFLLHDFRGLPNPRSDILLAYLLLLIAGNWNSAELPTLLQWRRKVYQMLFNGKVDNNVEIMSRCVYRPLLIFQKHWQLFH